MFFKRIHYNISRYKTTKPLNFQIQIIEFRAEQKLKVYKDNKRTAVVPRADRKGER